MTETIKVEWIRFGKFLVGAALLSGAGTWANYIIENGKLTLLAKEIELKELEQAGKLVDYAISANIGTRERFAQYFAYVTQSDGRRKLWNDYWQAIHPEYERLEKQTEQNVNELAELIRIKTKTHDQKARVVELEAELAEARKQLMVIPVSKVSYPDSSGYSGIVDAGGDTSGSSKSAWTKWLDWKEAAKGTPNPCPKGYRQGATITREMRTTGQPSLSEIRSQVECLDNQGNP